jgi:hypothetical protein
VSPDTFNALYEIGGGFVILLLNIRCTYRDKAVRGVNPWATGFFASWGYWNCWFYPAMDAWMSFAGAAFLAAMNTIWFAQLLYYSRKDRLSCTSTFAV